MEDLTCKISSVLFAKRETGFFVVKGVLEGSRNEITVRGSFPGVGLGVGLKVRFSGRYETHPTYGRQLSASSCEIVPEKGRVGIVSYLQHHVRTIGPVTAAKMYSALGDDLPRILETDPESIRKLDFLTGPQADAIIREWSEASETRTASVFLSGLGLNSSQIRNVYSRFGKDTRDVVKSDPYRLAECAGVGFPTSDAAARNVGVGPDDPRRVKAFVQFALGELASSEGHMYADSSSIMEHARRMFRRHSLTPFAHGEYLSESSFFRALADLRESGSVTCDGDRIYPTSSWKYESEAAACIAAAVSQPPFPFKDLSKSLVDFESGKNFSLSEEQRQAFMLLEQSRVCVISGFPGTGKTLLISAFVALFEEAGLNYSLLSPTGIAAKRLSQMTGKPAYTIHRALGFGRDGTWEFDSSNKYVVDAVIVDEMSMVDGSTFYHLVSALPPSTIVIMVGDSAQLPSVGPGYVLNNLMKCDVVPHVSLTRIYRQEKQSDIISVAHSVLRGERVDTSFHPSSEFVFLSYKKEDVMNEICDIASRMKAKDSNFQVVSPMYDGDFGVNNLNVRLREVLNPEYSSGRASKLRHGEADLYEGDRVMVVKNDYDRMIFNGDVGKVQRISIKNDEVEVKIFEWFDQDSKIPRYVDKVFTFKIEEARHVLKVAYACTIHRCVSPDTLVETPDGLCRISDIDSSGTIAAHGPRTYINKVVNPSGPMLRVTTADGYVIEMTPDHGVNAWDPDSGYVRKKASELCEGDILPLRIGSTWSDQPLRQLPLPTSGHRNELVHSVPSFLDPDMAEFLGLMVADGTIWDGGFRLVKSSGDVISRFALLCESKFHVQPRIISHDGTPAVEVFSTYLARWLSQIGGLSPRSKRVPEVVLRSSKLVQASFLRGLFEDGCVNIDSDRGVVDHIELLTCSESLFRDVKVMLLRFGIVSGFGNRLRTLKDGIQKSYRIIYVYGANASRFANEIGFISSYKQKLASLPCGAELKYQVPVLKSEALAIRDSNGGPSFFTLSDKNVLIRHRMSRKQLADLLSRVTVPTPESASLTDRLEYHHSPVMSIEAVEGPSVCVEVPDGHQFLQNGFLFWNCQGNEFDFIVMPMTMKFSVMLYRNLVYTAITRARKKVFIFGDPAAFRFSVDNDRETVRNSALAALIAENVPRTDSVEPVD